MATKKLPSGEELNGTKIYEQIIHYFTTTTLPVDEIYDKGAKVLEELYPKVSLLSLLAIFSTTFSCRVIVVQVKNLKIRI